MSNIRIKDLTTTAATTASDDFVAVDGTTNGTRKLNAFSPSFGGNLTVSGTGTSSFESTTPPTVAVQNTTSGLAGTQTGANGVLLGTLKFGHPSDAQSGNFPSIVGRFSLTDASFARCTALDFYTSSASGNARVGTFTELGNLLIGGTTDISGSGGLKVFGTTASTSTSTGALVVSGGVGVAGNAYIGGDLVVPGQNKAINAQGYFLFKGAYCNIFSRATSGGWSAGLVFHSSNTDPSASIVHDPTTGDLTLYTNATASNYASTDRALLINTSKQVQVLASTASTSTSSGALVVSGGVGVAGAIYAGGDIITTKSNGVIKASGSSANAEVAAERLTTTPSSASLVAAVSQPQLAFTSDTAGSYTWGRILANSSEIVRVHSANLTAIANVAGAGIAVAGGIINTGSLTTGAPSGGTAAAWKLGTVATVSPTSPNRTIEVDIGGTIYYIHAKTTNN
jgi:hypothetical protein